MKIVFDVIALFHFACSKSPVYEPSGCELSKMQICIPSALGRSETELALHLLLLQPSSSTLSHLFSLLQSVTLLACSLDARPCVPDVSLYGCIF